tara:strand:- start:1387 stop:1569 length:183 start_codon:yes stop_codon:yes gene_type:complete
MKVFKYTSNDRKNVIVLDKVVMVHMSASAGWITLQGVDCPIEVNKWVAEGLIKTMEEEGE